jgi:hypothetical protein
MLTEKQILTAYTLKKQGKTYRDIADAVGLDGRTQHSQVVNALRYFVMGYMAARREMPPATQGRTAWIERTLCFTAGAALYTAIAAIVFSI